METTKQLNKCRKPKEIWKHERDDVREIHKPHQAGYTVLRNNKGEPEIGVVTCTLEQEARNPR